MKKNRIIFLLWILGWLLIWLSSGRNEALLIIAASLISAVCDALLALQTVKRLTAELRCSPLAAKGQDVGLCLHLKNASFFSCGRGSLAVECENLLTGERQKHIVGFAASGKSETEISISFSFIHCGRVRFRVYKLSCFDMLGILGFSQSVELETAVLVLPQLYATRLEVSAGQVYDAESSEYSMYRSGFDAGETYALREYKPGDPIKNIHWKLSQKSDELILRELGLPIQNSLLILIENLAADEMSDSYTADTAEAMGEIAVSLSMALCEQKYEHRIAWADAAKRQVESCEICSEEDLNTAMSGILSAGLGSGAYGTAEQLAEQKGKLEYAHIIVITPGSAEPELPQAASAAVIWLHAAEHRMLREKGIYAEV